MLKGRRVLEAAPTAEQTNAFWDKCKRYLREPIEAGYIYKNESERILELSTGGRIHTNTACTADTVRGAYADPLILDEYSIMDPSTWTEVGAPMLLDNNGDAIFVFTPKRRNHAFQMFVKASDDATSRWDAWHFTSHDNPHLSKAALAEITQDMTESAYKQEILAEFLDSEGQVFRNVASCCKGALAKPEPAGGEYIIGVDLARLQDFTVLTVMGRLGRNVVAWDRFNQLDWQVQVARITHLAHEYYDAMIWVDSTGVGDPIYEQLRKAGLRVTPFSFTHTSKEALVNALQIAIEQNAITWPAELQTLTNEMLAFEYVQTPAGNVRYGAPEGMHDDAVISLALGNWGCVAARRKVSITCDHNADNIGAARIHSGDCRSGRRPAGASGDLAILLRW